MNLMYNYKNLKYKKYIKIIFCVIVFFLIYNKKAKAKNDSIYFFRNSLYFEIMGVGGFISLNYERIILKKKKFKIGIRTGLGTYNISDYTNKFNPDIIIPLSLNGFYGNKHKIEFGIGQTISNIVHANNSKFIPERITEIHANFTIGYRYRKKQGHFIFRCNYTPIIEFYKYLKHSAGISIGYVF